MDPYDLPHWNGCSDDVYHHMVPGSCWDNNWGHPLKKQGRKTVCKCHIQWWIHDIRIYMCSTCYYMGIGLGPGENQNKTASWAISTPHFLKHGAITHTHIDRQRNKMKLIVYLWSWLTLVAIGAHGAITLVVLDPTLGLVRAVHRNHGIVGAQAMKMSIMVREQTTLKKSNLFLQISQVRSGASFEESATTSPTNSKETSKILSGEAGGITPPPLYFCSCLTFNITYRVTNLQILKCDFFKIEKWSKLRGVCHESSSWTWTDSREA